MNRLTKKNNGTGSWTQLGDKYLPAHNIKHKQCVIKLGQLEDLEEELGINLFKVFNYLEVLDIIKRSIYSKEIHKYVMNEKLKGQKFMSIGLSIRGDDDINKIKEWLEDERISKN